MRHILVLIVSMSLMPGSAAKMEDRGLIASKNGGQRFDARHTPPPMPFFFSQGHQKGSYWRRFDTSFFVHFVFLNLACVSSSERFPLAWDNQVSTEAHAHVNTGTFLLPSGNFIRAIISSSLLPYVVSLVPCISFNQVFVLNHLFWQDLFTQESPDSSSKAPLMVFVREVQAL